MEWYIFYSYHKVKIRAGKWRQFCQLDVIVVAIRSPLHCRLNPVLQFFVSSSFCTLVPTNIFFRYRDISIFTKFNLATVRHLGFVRGSRGTTHEGPIMVAISCKNFSIAVLMLQCESKIFYPQWGFLRLEKNFRKPSGR